MGISAIAILAVAGFLYMEGYYGAYRIVSGTNISPSVYSNSFFNVHIDLPEWWEFQSISEQEVDESYDELGIDLLSVDEIKKYLKKSNMYTAFPKVDDGGNDPTSLVVYTQKISVWDCEGYLSYLTETYEKMNVKVIEIKELSSNISTSDEDFCRYDFSLELPNTYILQQRVLALLNWPYVLAIQMSDSENDYGYMERMVY